MSPTCRHRKEATDAEFDYINGVFAFNIAKLEPCPCDGASS